MSTYTQQPSNTETGPEGIDYPQRPEGPIAAAILAAGVGSLTLGVVTTLVEASASIKKSLTLSNAVGPLSGKVAITIGVWFVVWILLHLVYRNKPYETRRALTIAFILIGLGVVGTFPTFFQMFG
jgi:hypothetical protein